MKNSSIYFYLSKAYSINQRGGVYYISSLTCSNVHFSDIEISEVFEVTFGYQ